MENLKINQLFVIDVFNHNNENQKHIKCGRENNISKLEIIIVQKLLITCSSSLIGSLPTVGILLGFVETEELHLIISTGFVYLKYLLTYFFPVYQEFNHKFNNCLLCSLKTRQAQTSQKIVKNHN